MAKMTHEIEPGYGFQEEMAVERDHMGEGALRFALVAVAILVVVIIATVQLAKVEGQRAQVNNATFEAPAQLRMVRAEATQKLTRYEVLDAEAGVYQIPIERAMTLEVMEKREDQ
jgi:hypothetical protein